jgi:ABC-type transport system involved in cytochrome bd biosynthesis fused ATPase/permease subunit
MEFTAYLLSLLELIIILMFIPLMYSYSINKGKRLLWFSSPSFSFQSHPIPKLKKQRNLKKITEVSNVNDWNQPWVLTNSKFLPTDATECKKVWLLGPAGSGKTTLLEFMGIGQSHSDNIEATEGEEFITDCQWPNTIFVDTQGIYQVKGKADTEINEQIILDHAHQCADAIILVIPKLQRQDVTIFFEMVERMKNSHR